MIISEPWYWYRIIPIIIFLHPFYKAVKSNNNMALLVTGLYFFSALGSLLILPKHLPWHNFETDSPLYFLFYSSIIAPFLYLSLYLKPFQNLSSSKLNKIEYIFLYFLSIGAIYSFLYQLPYAINSISAGAHEIRRLISIDSAIMPSNIFTTIAVGFSMFFYVYIFMFYLSVVNKWNRFIRYSLFIGILSFVINVLTVAGRDGIVLTSIGLMFGYFYYENVLPSKFKRRFMVLISSLFIIGSILLMLMSIDRFGHRSGNAFSGAIQYGVINYISMQPFTFNSTIKLHEDFNRTQNFPILNEILKKDIDDNQSYYIPSQAYIYNFGGFVKSFYQSGGLIYTIIISSLFYSFFYWNIIKNNNPISLMFLLGFYMFFITSGLFYFRLGNSSGNLYMLFTLLGMVLFKYKYKF